MTKEVLKLALDALKEHCTAYLHHEEYYSSAIAAIEQALSRVDEPVAVQVWCSTCEGTGCVDNTLGGDNINATSHDKCPDCEGLGYWYRLVAQPKAEPTDLTKRLRDTASKGVSVWGDLQMEAAREIEILTAERESYASAMDRMQAAIARGKADSMSPLASEAGDARQVLAEAIASNAAPQARQPLTQVGTMLCMCFDEAAKSRCHRKGLCMRIEAHSIKGGAV